MDKVIGWVLSKGGVRWGAGGLLTAGGLALLSGQFVPDAGQETQLLGMAGVVGGMLVFAFGPKLLARFAGQGTDGASS